MSRNASRPHASRHSATERLRPVIDPEVFQVRQALVAASYEDWIEINPRSACVQGELWALRAPPAGRERSAPAILLQGWDHAALAVRDGALSLGGGEIRIASPSPAS